MSVVEQVSEENIAGSVDDEMVKELQATIEDVKHGRVHQLCLFYMDNDSTTHAKILVCESTDHEVLLLHHVVSISSSRLMQTMQAARAEAGSSGAVN